MSKMSAAVLDDLDYIVDPSSVSFSTVYAVGLRYARTRLTMLVTHTKLSL